MRLKLFALPALAIALLFAAPSAHAAQVSFGIQIGSPPVCPYGYFDYAPYNCAPYGYYGPEWFNNGIFLGAGPWFHGPHHFYGHVNNRYDPRYGYHGAFPHRGEHFNHYDGHGHYDFHDFHGNSMRDGRGHEHGGSRGHAQDHGHHR